MALLAVPQAAHAQEAQPGDACAVANTYRISGGPETTGKAFAMTCQGGVWVRITESDTAGNLGVKQSAPQATLHVGGETIVGNTGLVCDAARAGGLRWSSVNSTIEMCNGVAWQKIVASAGGMDCTPNAFAFTDLTNVPLSTLTTSNTLSITGIDPGCAVSVTGGGNPQISVNGGAWTTSTAINPGDTLQVRLTSSASFNAALVAAVAVGTATDNWSVTTKASNTRIFQTSGTYNGNLGGLIGADSACQTAAAALGYGSYWRAVLSDSLVGAKDRLTITYPIVKASSTSTTIAATNLWSGSLSNAVGGASRVWTGSDSDGTPTTETFGDWCNDWTSGSTTRVARSGYGSYTNGNWLYDAGPGCNDNYSLYCIEQPDPGCSPSGSTTFTDVSNAARSTQVTSNTITPTGCGASSTVMVVGSTGSSPQISINGGAWATSGTLPAGGTLRVRFTTGGNYGYGYKMRVYIGNTVTTWTVTTETGGHRIFATPSTYNGALGGFVGADTTCQNAAATAGLSGYWRAILSDSLVDAKTRFSITYPVVSASDGAVIAATDLWSGSLATVPATTGSTVWTGSASSGTKWSSWCGPGTCANNPGAFCNDWTSGTSTYSAQFGYENRTDSGWLSLDAQYCNSSRRLYCLEQANPGCSPSGSTTFTDVSNATVSTLYTSNTITPTGCGTSSTVMVGGIGNPQISINGGAWTSSGTMNAGDTLQVRLTTGANYGLGHKARVFIGNTVTTWTVTTQSGGKRIFATSNIYNGNLGGLSGADATCATEASALGYSGTWKAILSNSTTNAKDRVTVTYPVVRASDGAVVAATNLWSGGISTALASSGNTTWTGSASGGTKYNNWAGSASTDPTRYCSDWTDATGSTNANFGIENRTDGGWLTWDSATCNSSRRLYCIEQ